jgi:hypothetical protein
MILAIQVLDHVLPLKKIFQNETPRRFSRQPTVVIDFTKLQAGFD